MDPLKHAELESEIKKAVADLERISRLLHKVLVELEKVELITND